MRLSVIWAFMGSLLLFAAGAAMGQDKEGAESSKDEKWVEGGEVPAPPLYGEVVDLSAVDGGNATSLKVRRAATGQLEPAGIGTHFSPLDSLVTDANTIAQVDFEDGIILVLGESSDVTLSERTEHDEGIRTKVTLNEGTLSSKTLDFASKAGFEVHTPEGIITHEGSNTFIEVVKTSKGKFKVQVTVGEPSARVTLKGNAAKALLNQIGQSIGITNGALGDIIFEQAAQLNKLKKKFKHKSKSKFKKKAKKLWKSVDRDIRSRVPGSSDGQVNIFMNFNRNGTGTFNIIDQRQASP